MNTETFKVTLETGDEGFVTFTYNEGWYITAVNASTGFQFLLDELPMCDLNTRPEVLVGVTMTEYKDSNDDFSRITYDIEDVIEDSKEYSYTVEVLAQYVIKSIEQIED